MEKNQIQKVIELTDLPQDSVREFLEDAFLQRGQNLQLASLEDLRLVLADLLQDFILEEPQDH